MTEMFSEQNNQEFDEEGNPIPQDRIYQNQEMSIFDL